MIEIEGDKVSSVSPEGRKATMDLTKFLERVSPKVVSTGEDILPDGVKAIRSVGDLSVVVHQSTPQVYNLKWIAANSPSAYGPGTKYRNVRVALPYMLILATFQRNSDGERVLTHHNECFFMNKALANMSDELLFPGLLNCSKYPDREREKAHLAWICTQHLDVEDVSDTKTPVRDGIKALMQCLIGTGFNRSSENHEGSSWYNESSQVDKRIATVEQWEKETEKDSLFALDVPWIKTGKSLEDVINHIIKLASGGRSSGDDKVTADTLARYLFNK